MGTFKRGTPDARIKTQAEIFHSGYSKQESGCWIWTGSGVSKGKPTFYFNNMAYNARKYAADQMLGKNKSAEIINTCGNDLCVNPIHMKAVRDEEVCEGEGVAIDSDSIINEPKTYEEQLRQKNTLPSSEEAWNGDEEDEEAPQSREETDDVISNIPPAFRIKTPKGRTVYTDDLKEYCKKNKLTYHYMLGVAEGKYAQHKMYLCAFNK